MGSHMELARHLLFDEDGLFAANVKLYPGASRDATPQQFAEQIKKSIAEIEAGDYEEVDLSDD